MKLKKIKDFLIKNKIFVVIIVVFLIILALILTLLLTGKGEDDISSPDRVWQEDSGRYYESYEINFPDNLVARTNTYVGTYDVFGVENISHLDWVKNFVSTIRVVGLKYTEKSHPPLPGDPFYTIDQSVHYWEGGENFLTYDNAMDIMSFNFDVGVTIPGIQINPQSKESVESGLKEISERFFSENFEYVVDEISKVGDDYRVDYSRLLDGVPIGQDPWVYYLVLTPEGRLKEGHFLLAEFRKISQETVPSGEEIREKMGRADSRKFISFEFLDINEFEEFGYYGYSRTGTEMSNVDLEVVDLKYRYHSKFNEFVEVIFSFGGEGYVEIEGEEFRAYFNVEVE